MNRIISIVTDYLSRPTLTSGDVTLVYPDGSKYIGRINTARQRDGDGKYIPRFTSSGEYNIYSVTGMWVEDVPSDTMTVDCEFKNLHGRFTYCGAINKKNFEPVFVKN
jgi:hypothetical protein